MEAVGVALAILPLLLNQLDNYVQGLETIKGFRAKHYHRQLQGYFMRLRTQQRIFENYILDSLDGVEYEDENSDAGHSSLQELWKNPTVQSHLVSKLGSNFPPFAEVMREISSLLNELSQKLGWNETMTAENYWGNASTIEKQARKIRNIFSKSIYSDLLTRLTTANDTLGILLVQSDRQSKLERRRVSRVSLMRQKKARRSASSLHNAIMRGPYWKCSCKSQHSIYFAITPPHAEIKDPKGQDNNGAVFKLVFESRLTPGLLRVGDYGHEIEARPDLLQSAAGSLANSTCQDLSIHSHHPEKKRKVQFSLPTSTEASSSSPNQPRVSPIQDMCLALSTAQVRGTDSNILGYISDDLYRHNIHYVRSYAESLKSQSLVQLIAASRSPQATGSGRFIFPQVQRLRLGVNLAFSVLQFHGSWLKSQWRARDIMFDSKTPAGVENPFVFWNTIDGQNHDNQTGAATLIRSEILFPLGLVLLELSLCQSLESLCAPEDDDRVEAHRDLKTATRHMSFVRNESGDPYGDVVERCLLWPGVKESTLDSELMQEEVFQQIIMPLIENLKKFEGKSHGIY